MTQDERWMVRCNEVKGFIETNHQNPSKYALEEKLMVHFLKHGRKLMNAGNLKESSLEDVFRSILFGTDRGKRDFLPCYYQVDELSKMNSLEVAKLLSTAA